MTLAELGAQLREERVSLGLMVEDVATRLKIPARILRAIEEGNVNDLPHTVYTRGFIKGYGLILGYSSEKITELVDTLEGFDEDFSPPKTLEGPLLDDKRDGSKGKGGKLLLKLLVVALLGGAGYFYYSQVYAPTASLESTPADLPGNNSAGVAGQSSSGVGPSTPERPLDTLPSATATNVDPLLASDSGTVTQTSAVGTNFAQAQPDASAVAQPDTTTAGQANVPDTSASEADPVTTSGFAPLTNGTAVVPATTQTSAGPATSTPASGTTATSSTLPAGTHQVVVTAEADCWLHANADGTETREFVLKAGDTFAMPFKKSLTLKMGNAGGVKITFDGKDMGSPGASGQVKTITFPPQE